MLRQRYNNVVSRSSKNTEVHPLTNMKSIIDVFAYTRWKVKYVLIPDVCKIKFIRKDDKIGQNRIFEQRAGFPFLNRK